MVDSFEQVSQSLAQALIYCAEGNYQQACNQLEVAAGMLTAMNPAAERHEEVMGAEEQETEFVPAMAA